MSTQSKPHTIPAYKRLGLLIRPRQYHLAFLTLVVGIVVGGTLASLALGTNKHNVAMSAAKHADPELYEQLAQSNPRHLSDRRNWVNVYFVKKAWFWNSLCTLLIALTLKPYAGGVRGEGNRTPVPRRVQSLQDLISSKTFLRWAEATLGWFFFAMWFFGPSLFERYLINSGAECYMHKRPVERTLCKQRAWVHAHTHPELFAGLPEHVTTARPGWSGGHDVSGHTFILVLGMLLILENLVPYLPYVLPSFSVLRQSIPLSAYAQRDIFRTGSVLRRTVNIAAFSAASLLLMVWGTMLLITVVYHHHAYEKISGLLVALLVWAFMPKEWALTA